MNSPSVTEAPVGYMTLLLSKLRLYSLRETIGETITMPHGIALRTMQHARSESNTDYESRAKAYAEPFTIRVLKGVAYVASPNIL